MRRLSHNHSVCLINKAVAESNLKEDVNIFVKRDFQKITTAIYIRIAISHVYGGFQLIVYLSNIQICSLNTPALLSFVPLQISESLKHHCTLPTQHYTADRDS